jgi:intracellular sulfur oxidation DsrE/DsrF family protein
MNKLHSLTEDEQLNAYIDGQLDADDAARLERRLAGDPALRNRTEELRGVRLLVQCAMQAPCPELPQTAQRRTPLRPRRVLWQALTAGLLIAIGFLAGIGMPSRQPASDLQAYLTTGKLLIQPVGFTGSDDALAVYHISTANPEKIRGALDEVEVLLTMYARTGRNLRLEIVANAEGLNLLRTDTSPARERVQAMQQRYGNLKFLACGKTIERLKSERKAARIDLLPGVTVVPSAMDQVIERLQDGWSYIRA